MTRCTAWSASKASRHPTRSDGSRPRSSAKWFRVPAGMHTYGSSWRIATSATSAWEPSPPAMPITRAVSAASSASARRSWPACSSIALIPRARASSVRFARPARPSPERGLTSSTAPAVRGRLPGGRDEASGRVARRAAAPYTSRATASTPASRAPRSRMAASPPAMAATSATRATVRLGPRWVSAVHPAPMPIRRNTVAITTDSGSVISASTAATSATAAARRARSAASRLLTPVLPAAVPPRRGGLGQRLGLQLLVLLVGDRTAVEELLRLLDLLRRGAADPRASVCVGLAHGALCHAL